VSRYYGSLAPFSSRRGRSPIWRLVCASLSDDRVRTGASELLRAGGWSEELCCLVNPGRAGRQQSASNASASFSSHLPRLHPEARSARQALELPSGPGWGYGGAKGHLPRPASHRERSVAPTLSAINAWNALSHYPPPEQRRSP
jgi:hypothetical protein